MTDLADAAGDEGHPEAAADADVVDGAALAEPTDDPVGWGQAAARATAWALVVLLPVQVLAAVVLDDPGGRTTAEALDRWSSPGWRLLDWLVVLLGAAHGAAATWRALDRSRLGPGASRALAAAGAAVATLVAVAMTLAVLGVDAS